MRVTDSVLAPLYADECGVQLRLPRTPPSQLKRRSGEVSPCEGAVSGKTWAARFDAGLVDAVSGQRAGTSNNCDGLEERTRKAASGITSRLAGAIMRPFEDRGGRRRAAAWRSLACSLL